MLGLYAVIVVANERVGRRGRKMLLRGERVTVEDEDCWERRNMVVTAGYGRVWRVCEASLGRASRRFAPECEPRLYAAWVSTLERMADFGTVDPRASYVIPFRS